MEYVNFDLELSGCQKDETGDERFRVRVLDCPQGQMKLHEAEEVHLRWGERMRLYQLKKRGLELPEIIQRGEILGNLLFPPRVREFFANCRASLRDEKGLRIRLRLESLTLSDLPWEYAYFGKQDAPPMEGFLVLDRNLSLVRFETMGEKMVSLDPVGSGPLRMVVLMASPKKDPKSEFEELNLRDEKEKIERVIKERDEITPVFSLDVTAGMLMDALTENAHIFHFAGHGKFEGDLGLDDQGQGFIILVDEQKKAWPLSAEKLAMNLRKRGVRLAVLGACESARKDQVNAWTGVASALTRAGIPAVVGMQFNIEDDNAIAFSRQFYRALIKGQSIDAAVIDGRLAIYTQSKVENERDWGVPVLYLRTEEGVLFPTRLPPAKLPETVEAVNTGLNLLSEQINKNAAVHEAVCISKEKIEDTSRQIFEMEIFKTVHDALHTIEHECLRPMKEEAGRVKLRPYKIAFDKASLQIKGALKGLEMNPLLEDLFEDLLDRLRLAAEDFQAVVNLPEGAAVPERAAAIKKLSGKLDELLSGLPARLDASIFEAARKLNLDRLVELLTRVRVTLSTTTPEHHAELDQGIDALNRLRDELVKRTVEHKRLQVLDEKLRTVCVAETARGEVAKEWNRIKDVRSKLKPPFSPELAEVNEDLVAIEHDIDDAIGRKDEEDAMDHLREYFRSVSIVFRDVDSKLKEVCGQLGKVSKPLETVLSIC
jgi:hypothetical protein